MQPSNVRLVHVSMVLNQSVLRELSSTYQDAGTVTAANKIQMQVGISN